MATRTGRAAKTARSDLDHRIEAVRRFNRFYTQKIGVLQEGLLRTSIPLQEARLIYELAKRPQITPSQLAASLELDAGYVSRLLRSLEQRDLLRRTPCEDDGRQSRLSLTAAGRKAFRTLDGASRAEVARLLGSVPEDDRIRLLRSMRTIEDVLGSEGDEKVPYVLRPPAPGDYGWIVHRHGVLYSQEYGWDESFEALVAEIVGRFVRGFDAKRERCWIAERHGEIAGCVFLVRHPEEQGVAKLRLLLVEPKARGLGIGRRLVRECTRFARQVGYARIVLWTNSVLHSARRIYETEGYRLVGEEPHRSFGHDLVGQTWELDLSAPPSVDDSGR